MRASIFPVQLKKLREALDWSQDYLGQKANLPASSICHFENDTRAPAFDSLLRLAEAFDVSLDLLVYGKERE